MPSPSKLRKIIDSDPVLYSGTDKQVLNKLLAKNIDTFDRVQVKDIQQILFDQSDYMPLKAAQGNVDPQVAAIASTLQELFNTKMPTVNVMNPEFVSGMAYLVSKSIIKQTTADKITALANKRKISVVEKEGLGDINLATVVKARTL